MAGKSTLLRSIGLNAVLANAGAPVLAEDLTISRFTICASLGVQDSLLDGKSKFLAEIDRLKRALVVPTDERPVLFLIDEMLAGTNSLDRKTIAEAFVKTMIEQGAVGALSTHDLALTDVANSSGMHGTNMHMASAHAADPLNFDYILKPGRSTQSSALAIATLAGLVLA
jgi:DNA mismatch repair ATPase MutS